MRDEEAKDLVDQCKTLHEECLYTATTHYIMAEDESWKATLVIIVPSIVAAICSFTVSIGGIDKLGEGKGITALSAISVLCTTVVAIASALGLERSADAHTQAGKLLTALRHEVRPLYETYFKDMGRSEMSAELRRLNDRYCHLIQTLPSTNDDAFERARRKIKSGVFNTDHKAGE